ncbi:response regulator transcription factor [Paenibacillus radicis (ex Xue et al. 2023)]|uniref:Response regulator n=1 Tax=Paenibacillus radicis (ex Xue et al. 2023) TaxID=2972489 RepID=A0ABT1YB94_9BACL|nr:response regulator [Paenibacillus radicis (ex Xue et al. 2023)]MCR8630452.1 response regulator [Paenibacillus radicis (ex Xue et al. 2023)]
MYKLVIVDDEIEIRSGIAQYFPWHDLGFEVAYHCENGLIALDYILNHEVDVVLSDIKMPVMNGIELAQSIHQRRLNIKTVFLSGYKDFEYAKQALIYGVKNYIVKPTIYKELYDVFTLLKIELDEDKLPLPEATNTTEAPSFNEKVIQTIHDYVQQNYRNACLEDAARLIYMNPHYVSTYFKEKSGEYFSEYVLRVKMNKAAELLMDINFKTYEVSEMIGYSNTKNFARAFKQYFGKTPREYRNR